MKTILNIILTTIGMVGRLRGCEVFVSRKGAEGAEIFCQQMKQMKRFFTSTYHEYHEEFLFNQFNPC